MEITGNGIFDSNCQKQGLARKNDVKDKYQIIIKELNKQKAHVQQETILKSKILLENNTDADKTRLPKRMNSREFCHGSN